MAEDNVVTQEAPQEVEEFEFEETYIDEQVGEEDSVYVDTPPIPSDVSKKKVRAIDSAIKASASGDDPVAAYQEAYINDSNNVFMNASRNTVEAVTGVMKYAGQVPADAVAAEAENIVKRSKEPLLGPFYAYVDSLPTAASMSPEERKGAAYYTWLNNKMAEVYDEMSWLDIASDFLVAGLVPDTNIRIKEIADYIGADFGGMDYMDTTEFQAKMSSAISKLPVEARAALVNDLVDNWEQFGFVDNKLEMIAFLGRMTTFDSEEQAWSHIENALERTDQGMMALGLGKVFRWLGKKGTILRQMKRVNDLEGARVAAKAAMQGALKEVGVDPLDGANSVQPFKEIAKLTAGADESLALDIVTMDKQLKRLVDEYDPLDLPLSEADRTARIDKALKAAELDPEVTNVKVVEMDGKGFTLEMDTSAGAKKQKVSYKLSDIGSWVEDEQKVGKVPGSFVWSPNYRLSSVRKDLVQTPHIGLLQGAKFRKEIAEVAKRNFQSLSKKEFKKVDKLLLSGDGKGKVFSYSEAVDIGIDGVKYTPKEYKAYLGARKIFDAMYDVMNKRIIEEMKIRNVKKVTYNGVERAGKVYDEAVSAFRSFSTSNTHSKWYSVDGKVIKESLTSDLVKDMYAKGYKLVRAEGDDLFTTKGINTEWAFVKVGDIAELSGRVLSKVPGYVPKIREGANFFLKRKTKVKIGDKTVDRLVTERYASNYEDLKKFLATVDNPEDYIIRSDRQMSSAELAAEQIKVQGGLFTGKRKTSPIPYGTGEVEGTRKTALESLQRYINTIASSMPMSIYREGLRQKWINSAVEAGVLPSYTGKESFAALSVMIDHTHPKSRFFTQTHQEISFMSGMKTTSEQIFDTNLVKLGKYLEGTGIPFSKRLARFAYENRLQDAINVMKTAAYHTMLGMGNVAQTFIQGSGALVALSVNPVHGMKGLAHALDFMVLDQIGRFGNVKQLGKKLDVDAWRLWNKSGMREGVTSTNLDYTSIFADAPYDAGVLRKVLSNSDFFVKSGEMFYSRVAFGTAYDYMKAKLKRPLTDKDLPEIINRAEDYRMNMSRANTSKFQRGLISLPTQFMQVQTKFIEKVIGNDFTAAEKVRLVGAQAALYGSVGLPFVGTIVEPFLDGFGINAKDTPPEKLRIYKNGLMGYLLTEGTGLNIDFGGRVALGNDLAERALSFLIGDTNAVEMALGPSFSVLERTTDVLERACYVHKIMFHADDVDDATMLAGAKVIGTELLNIPASTRNILKAYTMLNSGMYYNKAGKAVFEYREPTFTAAFGQAMGFSNTEVSDWYDLAGVVDPFSNKKAVEGMATMMASTLTKMLNSGADEQYMYAAAYNALRSSLQGSDNADKVMEKFVNHLKSPNSPWREAYYKAMEKLGNNYQEGISEIMKDSKVRTNVSLAKEIEKAGIGEY